MQSLYNVQHQQTLSNIAYTYNWNCICIIVNIAYIFVFQDVRTYSGYCMWEQRPAWSSYTTSAVIWSPEQIFLRKLRYFCPELLDWTSKTVTLLMIVTTPPHTPRRYQSNAQNHNDREQRRERDETPQDDFDQISPDHERVARGCIILIFTFQSS